MDSAARRLQAIRGHIDPAESDSCREEAAGGAAAAPLARQSTAAAGGGALASSSYARVHGEVSRQQASWRDIESVARDTLQEVLYQKADADGIARVGPAILWHHDHDACFVHASFSAQPASLLHHALIMQVRRMAISESSIKCGHDARHALPVCCRSLSIGRTSAMPSRR